MKRWAIISDLADYFRQPEEKLFRHGDRIRVYTTKLFWLGGISNTANTITVGKNVTLIYRHTKEEHHYFDVAVNKDQKVKGLKNGDRVYISTLTFEGLDYDKI